MRGLLFYVLALSFTLAAAASLRLKPFEQEIFVGMEEEDSWDGRMLGMLFRDFKTIGDTVQGIYNGSLQMDLPEHITKEDIVQAYNDAEVLMAGFKEKYPEVWKAGKEVVIGAAIAIVAPELLAGMLGLFGFGARGIIYGSLASTVQSIIGNVPKGSLFAWLTSLAMKGVPHMRSALPRLAVTGLSWFAAQLWLLGQLWEAIKEMVKQVQP